MPGLKDEAKYLLRQLEAGARKKLGQNFMVDEGALEFIANAMSFKKDEPVIEIGPGLGFLTRFLLSHGAAVTAVEKDPAYAEFLKVFFKNKKFGVIQADVLKTKISELVAITPCKVCGNIPYNITSPILEWLILQKELVSEAVLTVQWEVAERMKAVPGTKEWGALSVFLQFNSEIKTLKRISPAAFSPEPKVDSAVIQIVFPKSPKYAVRDQALFFQLVRRSFQKRRKTLLNALEDEADERMSKKNIAVLLERANITSSRRPETLTLPEWALLANQF